MIYPIAMSGGDTGSLVETAAKYPPQTRAIFGGAIGGAIGHFVGKHALIGSAIGALLGYYAVTSGRNSP
jgi:hypothetical protein